MALRFPAHQLRLGAAPAAGERCVRLERGRASGYGALAPEQVGPVRIAASLSAPDYVSAWRYARLYPAHAKAGAARPGPLYWHWARAGWQRPSPRRDPVERRESPLGYWWRGALLDEAEARRRALGGYQARIADKPLFERLSGYLARGERLQIDDGTPYLATLDRRGLLALLEDDDPGFWRSPGAWLAVALACPPALLHHPDPETVARERQQRRDPEQNTLDFD